VLSVVLVDPDHFMGPKFAIVAGHFLPGEAKIIFNIFNKPVNDLM